MRRMLKITALMSSTTFLNIILNVIKVKAMAVLVGPSGMGMFSLYQSIYNVFLSLGGVISGGSVVKAVAEMHTDRDEQKLYTLQYLLQYVAIILGIISGVLFFLYRQEIAKLVFDDLDYVSEIGWFSLIFVIINLSLFWQSWLNGTRKIKEIAKVRIYTSFIVTLWSIFAVYIWGTDGIILAIMVLPIPGYFVARYYAKKYKLRHFNVSLKDFAPLFDIFRLGVILVVSALIFQLGVFGTRGIIMHTKGIESVGVVFAAWAISMSYIEIFLSSLTVDYYPALVSRKNNKELTIKLVNDQIHFLLLLLFPILLFIYVFSPYIVTVLYSEKFILAESILKYQLLGDIFKMLSWVFGYVLIVYGYLKFALLLQVIWVGGYLLLIWTGIDRIGLDITGIAFLVSYVIGTMLVYQFLYKKISFRFTTENIKLLKVIGGIVLIMLVFQTLFLDSFVVTLIEFVVALVFAGYSYRVIRKETGGFIWKKKINQ